MSLRSGKLPSLGSEDEFFDHKSSSVGGAPAEGTAVACLPALIRSDCCNSSARFMDDRLQRSFTSLCNAHSLLMVKLNGCL
jgi:hypothetical protein